MKQFIKNFFDKEDLNYLSSEYKYIIKAKDKLFSRWGLAENKTHIQLILAKDIEEKDAIINDIERDKTFSHVNWYPLEKCFYKNILQLRSKYSYTLRNDWTRHKNV